MCVNIPRTCGIRTAHKTRTKLPNRRQQVNIVATDEVLSHGRDGRIQRRLTVVIGCVLRDITGELRHTNLLSQTALQATEENLPLGRLETVHDMRKRPQIIRVTEMNELIVNESRVRDLSTRTGREHPLGIVVLKPLLTIICSLLVERERNVLICALVPDILKLMEILEPFACLGWRTRA